MLKFKNYIHFQNATYMVQNDTNTKNIKNTFIINTNFCYSFALIEKNNIIRLVYVLLSTALAM